MTDTAAGPAIGWPGAATGGVGMSAEAVEEAGCRCNLARLVWHSLFTQMPSKPW